MSERCQKKMVATPGLRMHYHPCRRKAWKDGWCKQHHPDSIAERRAKSDALYEERQKNSPLARLGKAANRIHELEARIKLAIQLDYAGYVGYVTPALRGQDIPSNVIERMKLILKQEGREQSDE